MKTTALRFVVTAFLGLLLVAGCTQMPTEKSGVADMRPQLSFNVGNENLLNARVAVDGMEVGVVADYLAGKSALRVLSGTHRVQVLSGNGVVLDEQVYVGDGVSRAFLVK